MGVHAPALRAQVADMRVGVKVGVAFAALVVLTAAAGGVAATTVGLLRTSEQEVQCARDVLSDVSAVEIALYRAESQQRAFLLTEQPSHRVEVDAALAEGQTRLAAAAVANGDPRTAELLDALRRQVQARTTRLTATLATYDGEGRAAAERLERAATDSELTRRVMLTVRQIGGRQQALLTAADARSRRITSAAVLCCVLGTFAVAGLALLTGCALAGHLTRRIKQVGYTAQAVAAGDLYVRCPRVGGDEIGAVAEAVNHMADSLAATMRRLEEDARSAAFARQLTTALDDTDSEADILRVVRRASELVAPGVPVEVLLTDATRARLTRALPVGAGDAKPTCDGVVTGSCRAFRSGRTATFPSSRALDACRHLPSRKEDGCAMVCIPLTALGGAIGVLRAMGPDGRPPDGRVLDRLSTLATVTAGRIAAIRALATAERRANTDGLTGLLNRRAFAERVRTLDETGRSYAVALADLDRFKELNDTYGHAIGDRGLQLFSALARRSLREEDLVARWGGEEFAFVLPDLDSAAATAVFERLRAALGDATERSRLPPFTASFGVSDSRIAETFHGRLRVADAGLLEAKQGGRDRVVVATPAMLTPASLGDASRPRVLLVADHTAG